MAHLCAVLLDNIQCVVNDDPKGGPRAALAFKPTYVRGNVSNAAGGQFPPSTKMEGRCTKNPYPNRQGNPSRTGKTPRLGMVASVSSTAG